MEGAEYRYSVVPYAEGHRQTHRGGRSASYEGFGARGQAARYETSESPTTRREAVPVDYVQSWTLLWGFLSTSYRGSNFR